MIAYLGNLLERVCNKTEFEVEGWRKIPPLMEILEKHVSAEVPKMKLNTIQHDPIITREQFKDAEKPLTVDKLGNQRKIKDSWIYRHFKESNTKDTKIAIYVNAVLPINQNLCDRIDIDEINGVGNHCVVVKGLANWKNGNGGTIECLELENNGGCEQTKFIPVEHPFFEEVCIKVKAEWQKRDKRYLNKYGKELAEMKWGKNKLESDWYNRKKEPKQDTQKKLTKEKWPDKYPMLFVRAIHPCFQLEFTS